MEKQPASPISTWPIKEFNVSNGAWNKAIRIANRMLRQGYSAVMACWDGREKLQPLYHRNCHTFKVTRWNEEARP